MDKNRKRAVATVACFTAAIVIWIGANFTVTALTTRTVEPDQQEPQTSRTEPAPSARRAATAQPKASVERLCAATAPAALKAYVTDTADRADQLERYFTQDAAGLDIPIGRIAPQPLTSSPDSSKPETTLPTPPHAASPRDSRPCGHSNTNTRT